MKISLLIILFCLPFTIKAQDLLVLPKDTTTGKVAYAEVIQAPGLSKDDLYIRTKEWFAKTFVSAQAVIQMDDKAAGKVIGKGLSYGYKTVLLSSFKFTIFYTVSLTVKDGRYRYEISDFSTQGSPSEYNRNPTKVPIDDYAFSPKYIKDNGEYKSSVKGELTAVNAEALKLAESIKAALAAPPTGAKSKDDF